jgi:hypothetical protein
MLCAYGSACWHHTVAQTFRASSRCRESRLSAEAALIISNNRDSAVSGFGVHNASPSVWINGAAYKDETLRDQAICAQLSSHDVDVVLLLGYMCRLGPATLRYFQNRILNIHTALLPKHGGKGKYGIHVHESALAVRQHGNGCVDSPCRCRVRSRPGHRPMPRVRAQRRYPSNTASRESSRESTSSSSRR